MKHTFSACVVEMALMGGVRVVDGGNAFDAYHIARLVRNHTHLVRETLDQILISRAFTCYQVVALLGEMLADNRPVLVLDLLSTFNDESVKEGERQRLLEVTMGHLERLKQHAPVLVFTSLRTLEGWSENMEEAAGPSWYIEERPQLPPPPGLFG